MGVSSRNRIDQRLIDIFKEVGDQSAGAILAKELALDGALDTKEFFEAFEFYERVRKRVRQPMMVDLACGHGFWYDSSFLQHQHRIRSGLSGYADAVLLTA